MNSNICHMKVARLVGLTLSLMLLLCGCTQQNGYLGALFGSWALEEITLDGERAELGEETVFSFQNEIVSIVGYVDAPFYARTRYGNFTHTGETLTLRFASEPTPTEGRQYMAPEWLYFPKDENVLRFEVNRLTGKTMELTLASEGKTACYTFRKTW